MYIYGSKKADRNLHIKQKKIQNRANSNASVCPYIHIYMRQRRKDIYLIDININEKKILMQKRTIVVAYLAYKVIQQFLTYQLQTV